MSRYINGTDVSSGNNTLKIVVENETTKYYPKFRNTPDTEKINPDDKVIYDGGSIDEDSEESTSSEKVIYDSGSVDGSD